MSLKLRFTIILRIDLLRFKLEGPDEVFQKKVDLRRGTGSQIQHVIVRVDHCRNGGERRRNRHQILLNHLFFDLLFQFRRHAVTLVGTHPDQLFPLTPRFEHGRRNLPLRLPQTDVNQVVPQNRLRLDFRIQQTPAGSPADFRFILHQVHISGTAGIQQIHIIFRQILRK